jgi:hypothetical protein
VLAALLSAAIVWSEATFFVHQPVLSLLALVFNAQRATYAYLSIEVNRVEGGAPVLPPTTRSIGTNIVAFAVDSDGGGGVFVFLRLLDCFQSAAAESVPAGGTPRHRRVQPHFLWNVSGKGTFYVYI